MVALVSPGGTKVEADEDLADVLKAQGWTAEDKPTQKRSAKKN